MDDRFALRFESGERQGDLIRIVAGGVSIGRRPGNTLQILDPSVSGKHAEFRLEGGGVVVKDLGSTNGTRVGGQRVIEAAVAHGDTVHVGNVRMTLIDSRLAEGGASTQAPAGGARGAATGDAGPADPPVPVGDATGSPGRAPARAPGATTGTSGATAAAGSGTAGDDVGPALSAVSAERLARSKSRSVVGLVLIVLLLLLGGGAAWFFMGSSEGDGARLRPVVGVPGNLLAASFSFEADDDGWRSDDRATNGFFETPGARYSGEVGVEAELAPGEWAAHASPWMRTGAGKRLTVRGFARTEGELIAALGIELAGKETRTDASEDEPGPATGRQPTPGNALAWARLTPDSAWDEVELAVDVPPGYERARVVLRGDAFGAGSVAFDDVSLVAASATPAPALELADVEVWALGAPAAELILCGLEAPFVTGLAVSTPVPAPTNAGGDEGADAGGDAADETVRARRPARLVLAAGEARVAVTAEDLPAGHQALLVLDAETSFANAELATMGEGGYRTHATGFEREAVTSLLIGSGRQLARVGFQGPVTVRGSGVGDRTRLEVALGDGRAFELQLDFRVERKRADDIAHEARKAGRDGDLGRCLARWAELLAEFPFEAGLVAEAEAARGRLIEAGMLEVRGVQEEVERARFFRLADLFRQCRSRAAAIAERYAPSEVEEAAYEVVAALDRELSAFAGDGDRDELLRLESIAAGLEAEGSAKLAEEVRAYLAGRRGESEER